MSLNGSQPNFARCLAVSWAGTLYIHFRGCCPVTEFCQVQNWLCVLQVLRCPIGSVTAWQSSSGREPNFAALSTEHHLYSTGRPSRWALAHILVMTWFASNYRAVYRNGECRSLEPFYGLLKYNILRLFVMCDVISGCACFCLHCYLDSIRSYFTHLCFKSLFPHLSLCLYVVVRSIVSTQDWTGCLVVCFPRMTSLLADLSGQFGPTKLVPQCPGSEVSWVQSVRNSVLWCVFSCAYFIFLCVFFAHLHCVPWCCWWCFKSVIACCNIHKLTSLRVD